MSARAVSQTVQSIARHDLQATLHDAVIGAKGWELTVAASRVLSGRRRSVFTELEASCC